MTFLVIDGAQGEGGGQVLRTALSLSVLTQTPIELINIRAKRRKPGLLRQHLTSVRAAAEICDAKIDSVEMGATSLRFSPGKVRPGDYRFSIGTAGSTVLVCQTILPILGLADGPSIVTFEGGTHNGMSPSLSFLEQSFLPLLKQMGITTEIDKRSLGFYPAGGGHWQMAITPTAKLKSLELLESVSEAANIADNCQVHALVSRLPVSIGEREVAKVQAVLGWQQSPATVEDVETRGPGNSLQLIINSQTHTSLFEMVGEHGVTAERVAKRCAGRVQTFLSAGAAVEEHLADQLLLPLALAGSGAFTTTQPSLHCETNIDVIQQFIDIDIKVQQLDTLRWKITLG